MNEQPRPQAHASIFADFPAARLAAITAELHELEQRRSRPLAKQAELLGRESETLPLSPAPPSATPETPTSPSASSAFRPLRLRRAHAAQTDVRI